MDFYEDENNPIRSVDDVSVPCPSGYQWSENDVSASDAGRTEDTKMHKMRLGTCVKLQLSWQNITTEKASRILAAFAPQYISVCYLDPHAGGYRTKEFYVGDRSAPLYNAKLGVWSGLSFNIIERTAEAREGDFD